MRTKGHLHDVGLRLSIWWTNYHSLEDHKQRSWEKTSYNLMIEIVLVFIITVAVVVLLCGFVCLFAYLCVSVGVCVGVRVNVCLCVFERDRQSVAEVKTWASETEIEPEDHRCVNECECVDPNLCFFPKNGLRSAGTNFTHQLKFRHSPIVSLIDGCFSTRKTKIDHKLFFSHSLKKKAIFKKLVFLLKQTAAVQQRTF